MCLLRCTSFVLLYMVSLMSCTDPELAAVSYEMREESILGTIIGNPVRDSNYPDLDRETFKFSLSATFEQLFHIDEQTGNFTTASRIDREDLCSELCVLHMDVNVEILDTDTNMYISSIPIPITVTIDDINDNRPEISPSPILLTVPESTEARTWIGNIVATDSDWEENSEISFSHSTNTPEEVKNLFLIEEETGKVILQEPLDYESRPKIIFQVEARDHGIPPLSSLNLVIVEVGDVKDNAPVININALSSTSPATVPESAAIGYLIAVVRVTDADSEVNGEFSCTVQGSTFALVPIEEMPSLYKLTLAAVLDIDIAAEHEVTVTCTDHAEDPRSSSESLTVQVEDENVKRK